jgi:hypothetical protein
LIAQSFEESRNTYGSPRVRLDLRELDHRCGKNRVARFMRESGLRARQKRRFQPRTTDSRHNHKIAENWLAKLPAPDRPGQRKYVSTIEHVACHEPPVPNHRSAGSGRSRLGRAFTRTSVATTSAIKTHARGERSQSLFGLFLLRDHCRVS